MERQRIQKNGHRPRQKQGVCDSLKRISDHQQHRQQEQREHSHHHPSSSFFSPLSAHLPPLLSSSSNAAGAVGGNVDRVLFNNLVEMVPLVETLMDRRGNTSFTRRASMIYTPNPSHSKKSVESKARRAIQIASEKKQKVVGDNISDEHNVAEKQDNDSDGFSLLPSSSIINEHVQKDREDISVLQEQVVALEKKLIEKDDCIKSAETSLASAEVTLDEMKHQVAEKDALVKSFHYELSNMKIKLADKQAAAEKLEWLVGEANNKVENLQNDIDSRDFEITALMQFFEELTRNSVVASPGGNDVYLDLFDHLPNIDIDEIAIEKERLVYEEALAFAKQNPSDEALAIVSKARIKLQSFID